MLLTSQIFVLAYILFVIRILPLHEVAIIGKANTAMNILTYIGTLGLTYTATQLIPKKISEKKFDEAAQLSKTYLKHGLLTSIISSQIILTLLLLTFKLEAQYILLTIITFTLLDIFIFLNRLNIAWLKIKRYSIFSYTRLIVLYSFTIPLYIATKNVTSIFYGWILGNGISLSLLYLYSKRDILTKISELETENRPHVIKLLSYGFPMYIVSILSILSMWIDRALSAIFLASESFAIYFVMSRIVSLAENFIMVTRTGLMPMLSYYTKGGEVERRYKVHATIFNIITIVTLGTVITLSLYGKEIIIILLGEKYVEGTQILQILLIALAIKILNTTLLTLPQATKYIKEIPIIHFASLATKTILIIALYGAGPIYIASSVLAGEVVAITINIAIYKKIKNLYRVKTKPLIKAIVALIAPTSISLIKTQNPQINLIIALISIIIYILTTAIIKTLTKEDIKYLKYTKMPIINKLINIYILIGRYKGHNKNYQQS